MALTPKRIACLPLLTVVLVLLLLVEVVLTNGFAPSGGRHRDLSPLARRPLPFHFLSTSNCRKDKHHRSEDTTVSLSKREEQPSSRNTLTSYHLLWSPTVWKKLLLTTLCLCITLQTAPRYFNFQWSFFPNHHETRSAILYTAVLPTLSSACCWIQVLLNAMAFGCAGFNTYLGPLRPFFLSVLTYLTMVTSTKPLTLATRWIIALLPELLHLWNSTGKARTKSTTSGTTTGANPATTSSPLVEMEVSLDCPTMGCVACIKTVNSSVREALEANEEIANSDIAVDSWLLVERKGGKAKVRFSTSGGEKESDLNNIAMTVVVQALQQAGFPCTVDELRRTR